jgi:hypothetical protein
VSFNANPIFKDDDGITRPSLTADMNSVEMLHEVFVQGLAADTSVRSTLRGVIAVIGSAFSIEPADEIG